ncbi:hypothetical protein EDD15DRAFT_1063691 [Pisolithus albus]|nr:hypothetical protein EDD15DRAFT_1063691 [Pisolithus albus]
MCGLSGTVLPFTRVVSWMLCLCSYQDTMPRAWCITNTTCLTSAMSMNFFWAALIMRSSQNFACASFFGLVHIQMTFGLGGGLSDFEGEAGAIEVVISRLVKWHRGSTSGLRECPRDGPAVR